MTKRSYGIGFLATAVIVVALITFLFPVSAAAGDDVVYVGTYNTRGSKGIYAYQFNDKTGELKELGLAAEAENASFLTVDANGKFLYAANEIGNFKGKPTGAVSAFSIDAAKGKLALLNQVSAVDPGPAHITLDRSGKYALIANYPLGSAASFPINKDGQLGESAAFVRHKGSSVNPERQKGPHGHAVTMSPDNRFAIVADLGLDQLIEYNFNAENGALTNPVVTKTAPGAGPRHLTFSPNGKFLYVINEMGSTVVTYAYDAKSGALKELQTVSTLPAGMDGPKWSAEIAVDAAGKYLYASNRGHNSIAVFAIDGEKGTLTYIEEVPSGGKTPRHFAIDPSGRWLLAAHQDSDNLVLFKISPETGRLTATGKQVHVGAPICVAFVEQK